jgi:hypothetical protein
MQGPKGFVGRFADGFNAGFDRFRNFYAWVLGGLIAHRWIVPLLGVLVIAVITERNIDIGSLVAAGATSGTPLFAIARDNGLRVRVHVPGRGAAAQAGLEATLDVPELPGRSFKGKVARTANSLDPATRTLLVEAGIDNPDGTLAPASTEPCTSWCRARRP